MPTLSSLFGQETALIALRRALESDCLAGAYLIAGAEGTGKSAVARAFAQAAACASPVQVPFDSCGSCESCRQAEAGVHSEIVTVSPAGEQLQIWQLWDRQGRQTRGILSRTLSYAPVVGRRRVYILEKADRLTESAANSLLKILEEPPPYALFLLLAPHPARVLPTVLSRCQIVRLRAVPTSELAGYLETAWNIDKERAAVMAAYSEGRVGQAIALASGPGVAEEIQRVLDYAESLPSAPPYRALKAAEQLRKLAAQTRALLGEEPSEPGEAAAADLDSGSAREKTGRKQFAAVLDLLVTFYRDLLALRVGAVQGTLVNQDRAAELGRLAAFGEPERWTACLDALLLARRRLDANANTSMVTEILLMRLLAG
jgi:DNA polymerase-3 subunit delta'